MGRELHRPNIWLTSVTQDSGQFSLEMSVSQMTWVTRRLDDSMGLIWAATWQNQQNECAPSEDSDQPGHPPILIRVFAVRMKNKNKKPWVLSYPLGAQRRLWSDWADAQADLSLRWAHTQFDCFVMSRLMLTILCLESHKKGFGKYDLDQDKTQRLIGLYTVFWKILK